MLTQYTCTVFTWLNATAYLSLKNQCSYNHYLMLEDNVYTHSYNFKINSGTAATIQGVVCNQVNMVCYN